MNMTHNLIVTSQYLTFLSFCTAGFFSPSGDIRGLFRRSVFAFPAFFRTFVAPCAIIAPDDQTTVMSAENGTTQSGTVHSGPKRVSDPIAESAQIRCGRSFKRRPDQYRSKGKISFGGDR